MTPKTGHALVESVIGEHEQQQRAHEHQAVATQQDAPSVVRIGEVPGRQDQQHERQELREPDQAEVEWLARDLVDLPADRDGLHLHRDRAEEAGRRDSA